MRRVGCCIQKIQEQEVAPEVAAAAARLLTARKPAAAVVALLGYLPAADNAEVAEAIRVGLAALAVRDGQPDKALVTALADRSPTRRGAAAEALTRAGVKGERAAVRKLLADPVPEVRLRTAAVLTYAGDRDAVPVLIGLLEVLPRREVELVEDILYRLAEGQSAVPAVPLGNKAEERKKCRDAWEQWWAVHQEKANLAQLGAQPRPLNYTLLVLLDENRVLEVDARNQILWQIGGLQLPLDVQMLGNDRVLVAEYEGNRVTERDREGKIKWEHSVIGPVVAQRLANGHTFIATAQQLLEINGEGRTVFTFLPPNGERIMKAVKLANGESLCLIASAGFNDREQPRILRVSADRKVVRSFPVNLALHLSGGRIQGLANGNVLVPHCQENKVSEYDRDGKEVWKLETEQPVIATRLPNGHTLVTAMTKERGAVEFDRNGAGVAVHGEQQSGHAGAAAVSLVFQW